MRHDRPDITVFKKEVKEAHLENKFQENINKYGYHLKRDLIDLWNLKQVLN